MAGGYKNKTWVNGSPPQLNADDLNLFKNEPNNLSTSAGITPDNADAQQTAKSVSTYSGTGDFYTESGAANAYVLSPIGAQLAPPILTTGMRVRFAPANSNTGASTVNVDGLGVKNIKINNGTTDPGPNILQNGIFITLVYDGTSFLADTAFATQRIIYDERPLPESRGTFGTGGDNVISGIVDMNPSLASSVWDNSVLANGKVFLRIMGFDFNTSANLFKIITQTPTTVFEHQLGGWGDSGVGKGSYTYIDLSAGSVTSLDLTVTSLLGINTTNEAASSFWDLLWNPTGTVSAGTSMSSSIVVEI